MMDLILGDALPWLIGALTVVVSLIVAWAKGARSARHRAEAEALRRDIETIKEVQDATGTIRTADDARGMLERRRDR